MGCVYYDDGSLCHVAHDVDTGRTRHRHLWHLHHGPYSYFLSSSSDPVQIETDDLTPNSNYSGCASSSDHYYSGGGDSVRGHDRVRGVRDDLSDDGCRSDCGRHYGNWCYDLHRLFRASFLYLFAADV